MPNTDRFSLLERWANGAEAFRDAMETKYGPAPTPPQLPPYTTYDAMLEAIVDNTVGAKRLLNKKSPTYHSDSAGYTKVVPAGDVHYASLEQIGGKTLVWNQLRTDTDATKTADGITTAYNSTTHLVSITNNSRTTNYSTGSTQVALGNLSSSKVGHKMLVWTDATDVGVEVYVASSSWISNSNLNTIVTNSKSGTIQLRVSSSYDFVTAHPVGNVYSFHINIFDLTLMYGIGNEPSTVEEFQQQFPAQYYSYNAGTLLSAGVTEVVSKDSNNTTLQTITIPAEVQALEGYGWSAGSVYNYIDYERKVFVKCVDKIVLDGTQNPTLTNWRPLTNSVGWAYSVSVPPNAKKPSVNTDLANIITDRLPTIRYSARFSGDPTIYYADTPAVALSDSTVYGLFVRVADTSLTTATAINTYLSANPLTVYYELATPIETDISAYLTDDNLISVESGGTLTFPNSNGDDYRIPVPSSVTFVVGEP